MANYFILGANGGIGSATSRKLREAGHAVVLAGRNQAELQTLAAEIDAPVKMAEATDWSSLDAAVQESTELLGQLDGVVNCAGSVLLKPAHLTTPDEWAHTLQVNLSSSFGLLRAAYSSMKQSGGSIVLMASAAARLGLPNHEAIAAAKAGVIGLMQSAAATYAARRIRVNAVAPGLVQTKMTSKIWQNEKSAEFSRSMHAAGRLGRPEDVASLIVWLLQPENDWVTGQVFGIDGGLGTLRVTAR